MLTIALKMLAGDRGKYAGLLFGIAFTSFLITFAASFFCGFMTRGFSLISDIPAADVWVMDPAVESVEQTTNMPSSALDRVRSVDGVRSAVPLALATAEVRFPNGRFLSFQLIGVDDATFVGVPLRNESALVEPAASPRRRADRLRWVRREARDTAIGARSVATRCTPPCSADPTARRWRRAAGKRSSRRRRWLRERPAAVPTPTTHVFDPVQRTADPATGAAPTDVRAGKRRRGRRAHRPGRRIHVQTGLRARTAGEFKEDTVRWTLVNSEDVGDVGAMLTLAMTVGFGITAVLLYLFTTEHLRDYAVLKSMGATSRLLLGMIFVQTGVCAIVGTGLGLGLCGIAGPIVSAWGFPFRMMWFTPLLGSVMVLVVSLLAALISARPVLKLEPAAVFAGRA